jgi:hypothetical protein
LFSDEILDNITMNGTNFRFHNGEQGWTIVIWYQHGLINSYPAKMRQDCIIMTVAVIPLRTPQFEISLRARSLYAASVTSYF